MTNTEKYIEDIERAAILLALAQADLENAVTRAVLGGTSWAKIGTTLEISKQTAYNRYSKSAGYAERAESGELDMPAQYLNGIFNPEPYVTSNPNRTSSYQRQDTTPEPSKISDTEVAGDSVTPSIFSDAPAPAKAKRTPKATGWTLKGSPYTPARTPHTIPDPDETAQPGTGKGPHQCPGCGDTNHKTEHKNLAVFRENCEPTKYDPPKIAALMQEKNA